MSKILSTLLCFTLIVSNSSGISQITRIVGGSNAIPGEFPWQISLQGRSGYHYCGGTILDEIHIVTAAHCAGYDPSEMVVLAGAYNIHWRTWKDSQQRLQVSTRKIHPKYSTKTLENDIAILTLEKPLNFSDPRVQPLRMAPNGHEPSGSCVASGWGMTDNDNKYSYSDILQKIGLNIMARVPCKKKLPGIRASMICAGTGEKDKGTCMGDSGGPLVCFDLPDGLPYLAGAVSWGRTGRCGQVGYPSAFANIANLRPFIDAEI